MRRCRSWSVGRVSEVVLAVVVIFFVAVGSEVSGVSTAGTESDVAEAIFNASRRDTTWAIR